MWFAIEMLDQMLGEGLLPGTLNVVYAATGIWKTHLGRHPYGEAGVHGSQFRVYGSAPCLGFVGVMGFVALIGGRRVGPPVSGLWSPVSSLSAMAKETV